MEKYFNKVLLTTCLLIVSACSTTSNIVNTENVSDTLTIYLLRHAEKTKQRPDPGLTEEGKQRALDLVEVLKDEKITVIHSSDYIRTKETARPLAELLNLDIQLYDPSDLPGMAQSLKMLSGTHLVVGHSNTTPQLVELLGGDSVSEIDEATEYDRLYIVKINSNQTSSELRRFGKKYNK